MLKHIKLALIILDRKDNLKDIYLEEFQNKYLVLHRAIVLRWNFQTFPGFPDPWEPWLLEAVFANTRLFCKVESGPECQFSGRVWIHKRQNNFNSLVYQQNHKVKTLYCNNHWKLKKKNIEKPNTIISPHFEAFSFLWWNRILMMERTLFSIQNSARTEDGSRVRDFFFQILSPVLRAMSQECATARQHWTCSARWFNN